MSRTGWWTVPNALSGLRLLGVPVLLWAAAGDRRVLFLWIMLVMLATDWLDGKLAAALDQRSAAGARLDSAADWAMHAALGVSFWWMQGPLLRRHAAWIIAALATWGLSAGVSLARFGRLPSYHTRAAKTSWLVVGAAAVHLLLTGRGWSLPWALGLVALTNLEATAMGLVLPRWTADVPGLGRALELRARARREDESAPASSTSS